SPCAIVTNLTELGSVVKRKTAGARAESSFFLLALCRGGHQCRCRSTNWRRRRDSNPRDPFESNGFQDRRFQPLTHSSAFNSSVLFELAASLCHSRYQFAENKETDYLR